MFHEERYPCKKLIVNETQLIKCSMEFLKMCNFPCKYGNKSVNNRNFRFKISGQLDGKICRARPVGHGGGGSPGGRRAGGSD
jgi:hypothetical protein